MILYVILIILSIYYTLPVSVLILSCIGLVFNVIATSIKAYIEKQETTNLKDKLKTLDTKVTQILRRGL